jgi:polysaccharide export outer membrane protein
MKKKNVHSSLVFILMTMVLLSCVNKKKMIYFQGDKSIASDSSFKYSPVLHTDDLLSITVMGMDVEAVKPFNLSTYGNYSINTVNTVTSPTLLVGYLIDTRGEIEFPVIGKIKLAGLNRTQAADFIKDKLKAYLKEPMVNIQILNYKVTILGDVLKPGTYIVPNERLTLIEAIGLAGDLNITGLRKNVLVIRDTEGKKTETRVDLTTKDVFTSPVYYLQQNDVVYVEQNRPRKNSSALNPANITIFLSVTTLLITFFTIFKK